MDELSQLYYRYLLRYPEEEVIQKWNGSSLIQLEKEIQTSEEAKYCKLIKEYLGITLNEKSTQRRKVEQIYDDYSRLLLRNCTWKELRDALQNDANGTVDLKNTDEYRYLQECIQNFDSLTLQKIHHNPKIRYYGPIGTSGYATICRQIVNAMIVAGIDLQFEVCSVEDFNPDDQSSENELLSKLITHSNDPVDCVIVHSIPERWTPIVKRERKRNPFVKMYGITVWESTRIPVHWKPHLYQMDVISVPNKWNAETIKKECPELKVVTIHHPVNLPKQSSQRNSENYLFYSINHWSNRKGIYELIEAYSQAFTSIDKVCLILKTSGITDKELQKNINYIQREYDSPPQIKIITTRLNSQEIVSLHYQCHCFVSLCKAEGHGLGLCQAALAGNHIIVTGYGGQLDYLRNVDLIDHKMVPACFCFPEEPKHWSCQDLPACIDFGSFVPAQQEWAQPSIVHSIQLMREAYQERKLGEPETRHFLEENFNLKKVGENFYKSLSEIQPNHVDLKDDPYNLPTSALRPVKNFIQMKKKKILFLGYYCSGNVGDASYAKIWQQIIDQTKYEFYSFPVNKRFTAFIPDYIVAGGGGLIMKESNILLNYYFPLCQKHQIPFAMVSVGVQYDQKNTDHLKFLQDWKPLLNYSSLITVRSIHDYGLLYEILQPKRRYRLKVASDICHIVPELFPVVNHHKDLILYIPTNFLSIRYVDVRNYIQNLLKEDSRLQLMLLPFDGIVDEYPTKTIKEEVSLLKKYFPPTIIHLGRAPFPNEKMSLDEVYSYLSRARHIVTGRFHGLIFGRVFGAKVYVGTSNTNKIIAELQSPLTRESAWDHQKYLNRFFQYPHLDDPSEWSEDYRNMMIVQISQKYNQSIPFTQSLTNQQLFEA
jgi:glycosyltransferase involved in cell wall biosynthesis